MSLKLKQTSCPFCEGVGTRLGKLGEVQDCPACDSSGKLLVGNDGNFYSRLGGRVKGTWGGHYANLEEQGVPDFQA